MADADDLIEAVEQAATWDARVALLRKVPEDFGIAQHQAVYAEIARRVYVPNLAPDFAYVPWRGEYELEPFRVAYEEAVKLTDGFRRVSTEDLAAALRAAPETLRIFRTLLGFTAQEFA